ncbi:hypothetical protein FQN60_002652 [Etheostoma spectabile]|uniref:Uncharacterized protein n=1 Tax=Etheostoma spectabile TaxID=54343 RepID=A0A5J5CM12_9PERO|nr:hypothetical protein FQN60_002652 [Etheostoma spectabile]
MPGVTTIRALKAHLAHLHL